MSNSGLDQIRSPEELDPLQATGLLSDSFESMFSPRECATLQSHYQFQHSKLLDSRLPEGAPPSDVLFMHRPETDSGFTPSQPQHLPPQVSETDYDAVLAELISGN